MTRSSYLLVLLTWTTAACAQGKEALEGLILLKERGGEPAIYIDTGGEQLELRSTGELNRTLAAIVRRTVEPETRRGDPISLQGERKGAVFSVAGVLSHRLETRKGVVELDATGNRVLALRNGNGVVPLAPGSGLTDVLHASRPQAITVRGLVRLGTTPAGEFMWVDGILAKTTSGAAYRDSPSSGLSTISGWLGSGQTLWVKKLQSGYFQYGKNWVTDEKVELVSESAPATRKRQLGTTKILSDRLGK